MKRQTIERKGWNWAPVPAEVFLSKNLSHADVRVYAYLLWRAGTKQDAWPNVDTISRECIMSMAAVRRSLGALVRNNWIRRERRVNRSSVTFVFESQEECQKFNPRQLTGDTTVSSQVIRLNKSHVNENNNGANAPNPEQSYKKRIAEAITKGQNRNATITQELNRLFHRNYPWGTKTGRAVYQYLAEIDATPQDAAAFARWWHSNDWRGQKGQAPTVTHIQELWPQAFAAQAAEPTGTIYR